MNVVKARSRRLAVEVVGSSADGLLRVLSIVVSMALFPMVGCVKTISTSLALTTGTPKTLTIQGLTTINVGTQAQFSVTNLPSPAPVISWTITAANQANVGAISTSGVFTAVNTLPSNPAFSVVASAAGYANGSLPVTLAQAVSTTYYVDALNGDDSNPGTSTTKPWRTVGRVNQSTLNPGESVLFASGGSWKETLQVPSSGSPTAPITFGAYGSGAAPILDGTVAVPSWAAMPEPGFTTYYATLPERPYVVTMDGTFLWAGVESTAALNPSQLPLNQLSPGQFIWDSSSSRVYVRLPNDVNPSQHLMEVGQAIAPVYIDGKSNILIQNLQISGGNWNCVRIFDQSDNVQILNNVIRNCGSEGNQAAVFVDGARQVLIHGNKISYGAIAGVNVSGYNNAISDSATISGNTIDHMGYDCVVIGPIYNGSLANAIIENNDVSYCGQVRQDSAGIDAYLPGQNMIVRYNYVHNGGTSRSYSAGIRFDDGSENETAYGNIVYLNSSGCFQLTGTKNSVYNNTCYHNNELDNYDYGELNSFVSAISGPPQGLQAFNNIVSASVEKHVVLIDPGATSGQSIFRNLYDASETPPAFQWGGTELDFTGWRTKTGQDSGSPLPAPAGYQSPATYSFTLDTTSPAIGQGMHVDGYVKDISGTPVPLVVPDLGAHQHPTF